VIAACGSRTGLWLDLGASAPRDGGHSPAIDSGENGNDAGERSVHDSGLDEPPIDAGADVSTGSEARSCGKGGPGLTNCGEARESCCASLEVEGGTFYRTYTNDGGGPTGEADPARVSSFRLDKYIVTVGRLRQFVETWNGSGWTPPAGSGKHAHLNGGLGLENSAQPGTYESGWRVADDGQIAPTDQNLSCDTPAPGIVSPTYTTWTPSPGPHENLPIDCPNWWEAYAFCIWDGGFLPSEAEWEYAAAGGSQQREYPWGSTDPGTSSQYAICNCDYPVVGNCVGVANFAPVGTASRGGGLWGQLDMSGEIFEWNLDWSLPYVDPCIDCAALTSGTVRSIRGGSFWTRAGQPPGRNVEAPGDRSHDLGLGFRCARSP